MIYSCNYGYKLVVSNLVCGFSAFRLRLLRHIFPYLIMVLDFDVLAFVRHAFISVYITLSDTMIYTIRYKQFTSY